MSERQSVPVLQAQGLRKDYTEGPQPLCVLASVDLEVPVQASIAIVGSSGSGKSTLMHVLGGLDGATAGTACIDGQPWNQLSERQKGRVRNRRLGFVYQFHHLLPEFTALENVALPALIAGMTPDAARERASELLDDMGLSHRLDHKPSELSGGERQRAAIARALVNRPGCVLADEPTGNLDRRNARLALQVLLDMRERYQTGILVVTHDREVAAAMDQVWRLEDGCLVRE